MAVPFHLLHRYSASSLLPGPKVCTSSAVSWCPGRAQWRLLSPSPGHQNPEGTAQRGGGTRTYMVFRVQELVLGGARSQHLLSSSSQPEVVHPSSPTGQLECSRGNKAEEPMPPNVEIPSNLLRTVACICCETHRAGHLPTSTLRVVSCFPAPLETQWGVAALNQLGPLYPRP